MIYSILAPLRISIVSHWNITFASLLSDINVGLLVVLILLFYYYVSTNNNQDIRKKSKDILFQCWAPLTVQRARAVIFDQDF